MNLTRYFPPRHLAVSNYCAGIRNHYRKYSTRNMEDIINNISSCNLSWDTNSETVWKHPGGNVAEQRRLNITEKRRRKKQDINGFAKVIKRDPHCRRFRVKLEYDGKKFHGWQKQRSPEGKPLSTIEGTLEGHLRPVLRQSIKFFPSGRTDAGVSAKGQVAIFSAMIASSSISSLTKKERQNLSASRIRIQIGNDLANIETVHRLFNEALPDTIRIKEMIMVSNKFDAMTNFWKQYRYTLPSGTLELTKFCEFLASCDHMPGIKEDRKVTDTHFDIAAMKVAARHIIGTHDFSAFQSKGGRKSTIRTVFDCCIELKKCGNNDEISIVVVGNGFLYNMVRIIAGTLCLVGRNIITPEHIPKIIVSRNRTHAGPTAWAHGLCLEHVEYETPWNTSNKRP